MSEKKSKDNVHQGHRKRLKARFKEHGIESMELHNVMELLLCYSIPRKDTNEIAHKLLTKFGCFSAVLDAPLFELENTEGITENTAVLLKLIPNLCRLYMDDKYSEKLILDTPDKVGDFLLNKYIGYTEEVFSMICMDNKCNLINFFIVSHGSANATEVHIRKIIENAINFNATTIIIAHNHPQGLAIPSANDIASTKKILQALRLINIELADHIIIANNDYVSLGQSGSNIFST